MKRKGLTIALGALFAVCTLGAMSACSILDYLDYFKPAHVHAGGTATCSQRAVCEECGEEYGEFDITNHDLEEFEGKEPTCVDVGWNAYQACKDCDYTTKKEIAATGVHTGGTATCTEQAVCEVCGASYGELDLDNHDLERHDAKAPTCSEVGWEEYYTCKREGCDLDTKEEIAATGVHKGGTATCTEQAICDECHKGYGSLDDANHAHLTKTEAKDPTCTEKGNVEYWTCEDCKKNFSDENASEEAKNVFINATGHSFGEGVVNAEDPTKKTFSCACGESVEKTVLTAPTTKIFYRESAGSYTFALDREAFGTEYNGKKSVLIMDGVDYVRIDLFDNAEGTGTPIISFKLKGDSATGGGYFVDMNDENKVALNGTLGNLYMITSQADWCKNVLSVYLGEKYEIGKTVYFFAQIVATSDSLYCDSAVTDLAMSETLVDLVERIPMMVWNDFRNYKNNTLEFDRGTHLLKDELWLAEIDHAEFYMYKTADKEKTIIGTLKLWWTDEGKIYFSTMDGSVSLTIYGGLGNMYWQNTTDNSALLNLFKTAMGEENYEVGTSYSFQGRYIAKEGSSYADSPIYDWNTTNERVFVAE